MENALVVLGPTFAGLVAFVLIRLRAPSIAHNSIARSRVARNWIARNLIDPGLHAGEFPLQEDCSCGTIENKAS